MSKTAISKIIAGVLVVIILFTGGFLIGRGTKNHEQISSTNTENLVTAPATETDSETAPATEFTTDLAFVMSRKYESDFTRFDMDEKGQQWLCYAVYDAPSKTIITDDDEEKVIYRFDQDDKITYLGSLSDMVDAYFKVMHQDGKEEIFCFTLCGNDKKLEIFTMEDF